jgi:hypothetical protein
MTSIGEYLDRMVVSTTSPDQNIHARVSNYSEIEIEFRRGAFDTYDEERLSHQLARLGVLTWIAYRRGRSEAYRRSRGPGRDEFAEEAKLSDDPRQRRYEEALNNIEGEIILLKAKHFDLGIPRRWRDRTAELRAINRL